MSEQGLTQEYLKSRLLYSPKSGVFYWIQPPKNHAGLLGELAGHETQGNSKTYHVIKIDGRAYRRGRLAFLYMTGAWPSEMIDHIDGDSLNDCWCNLRAATPTQNAWNHKKRKRGSALPMGVRENGIGRFSARIGVNRKQICLGTFGTIKEAEKAYREAREEYYGEFA